MTYKEAREALKKIPGFQWLCEEDAVISLDGEFKIESMETILAILRALDKPVEGQK